MEKEALSTLTLFGETSLWRALREYVIDLHQERNHQGKGNVLLFPTTTKSMNHLQGLINGKERLGGRLKYYYRDVA